MVRSRVASGGVEQHCHVFCLNTGGAVNDNGLVCVAVQNPPHHDVLNSFGWTWNNM